MKRVLIFMYITLLSITFIIAETNNTSCETDNLYLCLDETNCTDVGGFWYNEVCNDEEATCEPYPETNKCCLGDTCNEMTLECQEGLTPVFQSCDTECKPIAFCEQNETSDECDSDADCHNAYDEGYTCEDGTCVETVECDSDADCHSEYGKGYTCESGTCIKTIKQVIQERNKIRFEEKTGVECLEGCVCTGIVMKCQLGEGGREMTIYSRSGNVIVQVKNTNMTTNVTLYHHNNKTYGVFKNNETKQILMPDQIKEKICERIKQRDCDCDEMELTDNVLYEIQTKKKARLFWIFSVREKARVQVDAENGEIIKFKNPWWGFLARDVEDG